jgi:sugar-specific transcriptional regulator TrmB
MHNGSEARVLRAVCQGGRDAKVIAEMAKVSPARIYTYLRRLGDKKLIEAVKDPGNGTTYQLKDVGCLLADIW